MKMCALSEAPVQECRSVNLKEVSSNTHPNNPHKVNCQEGGGLTYQLMLTHKGSNSHIQIYAN